MAISCLVSHPFFASLGFRPSSLPGGAIFGSLCLIVASQTSFIERRREAVRGLACDSALIDGEAVVLRKDGRGDFGEPSAPVRAADIANVGNRRAAKLRRPRHPPTRHNKLPRPPGPRSRPPRPLRWGR